jgi:hypothetical protein
LCDHAKAVLARIDQDHPLEIEEIDLSTEIGRGLAEQGGVMFAPGVFLDGRPFAFGRLSERRLRKVLAKSSTRS